MEKILHWVRNHSSWVGVGVIFLTFILNNIFDMPRLWGWAPTILILVILNRHLIPQYWAMIWVRIKFGFQLPSKENYTCKSNYILPFTGRWCVYDGGVTKELSIAWSEMSQRYAYFFIILTDGMTAYLDTWDTKGNHIIIQHNDSEYSYVGNLMPNSVSVKVGDRVKQGDVIAKCGNSGYTNEPHLHFQLQSSKSFNLSAGLPIAFANIKAKDSVGYKMWHQKAGVEHPTTKGNLEVIGNKSYIGRGLDVENGFVESHTGSV